MFIYVCSTLHAMMKALWGHRYIGITPKELAEETSFVLHALLLCLRPQGRRFRINTEVLCVGVHPPFWAL